MSNEINISNGVYALFSNIFAKEPTREFLQVLQLRENEDLFKSFKIDPLSDIKHLSLDEQVESLSVEYARLFLVPGVVTSPRESLQRGEGKLWGETTVEVNEIYKRFGFERDSCFKDTPDHLSAELSFLAQLSKLESEYTNCGLIDEREGVVEVKRYFLKNHILKWFFRFKEEVSRNAKLSYYKEFSCLLELILNDECKNLKGK